jgi:hypothetical protein
LLQILLRHGSNLAFKIRIGGNEKPRFARVHASLHVIERRRKNLRLRQTNMNRLSMNLNIARLQMAQIDSGNRLPVDHEQ